jgi:hypothetical protein
MGDAIKDILKSVLGDGAVVWVEKRSGLCWGMPADRSFTIVVAVGGEVETAE